MSKKTLNLPNNGGHHIISKIIMGDQTYIFFFDFPIHQEKNVWVFEDDPKPTILKRQQTMKKVMHAVFFKSTSLVKII